MKNIVIYVQHLLGSGHFVRAYAIANALAHKGHNVHLISGGFTVPNAIKNPSKNLHIFQLMPMRSIDENFSHLVTTNQQGEASAVDSAFFQEREQQLLNYINQHDFDIAIIETYPFGRRQLRTEISRMLETLKAEHRACKIFTSIRDILQRRKDTREQETVEVLNKYFDGVLIHADKRFAQLSDSFTRASEISIPIYYTGYVYQSNAVQADALSNGASKKIVVSAGGSDQGFELLKTVILASKKLTALTNANAINWHILYSQSLASNEIEILHDLTKDNNFICEPNRPDYPELIATADLVISYAGYNSVMDVFNAKVNALFIPFNKGEETEQTDRALALKKSKRAYIYAHKTLQVDAMASSIESAINNSDRLDMNAFELPAMNGVEATSEIVVNAI